MPTQITTNAQAAANPIAKTDDVLNEPHFPLVSIQYEREKASFSIFDYDSHSAKAISLKKALVIDPPKLIFVRDEYKAGK